MDNLREGMLMATRIRIRQSRSLLLKGFLRPAHRVWLSLQKRINILRPCRVAILVVGIVFGGLTFTSWGQDLLRTQISRTFWGVDNWQPFFFISGTLIFAFCAWYWSRWMLYLAFPYVPGNLDQFRGLRRWAPRAIGFFAAFGLSIALLKASFGYGLDDNGDEPALLRWYSLICFLGADAFVLFVYYRRNLSRAVYARWRNSPLAKGHYTASVFRLFDVPKIEQEEYGVRSFGTLPARVRVVLYGTIAISLVLFVPFTISVEHVAPVVGSVGILLIAASGWIAVGSALDLLGRRLRVPIFLLLGLLAAIFSLWNDNHAVRVSSSPTQPWSQRANVERALRNWITFQQIRPTRPHDKYPLFLVSAEGGGIRAAFWTATVLGEIQKQNPCFADQLFALSGVSGGSLGVSVFAALLSDTNTGAFRCDQNTEAQHMDIQRKAQDVLSEDFLSPLVGAMLYPDLLQRMLWFSVPQLDRARSIEAAWEKAWRSHARSNRFAEPFDQLWRDQREAWMPALFLNSTWVEGGKRLIVSNLRVKSGEKEAWPVFTHVEDLHKFYIERTLPLSAAVHLSARFPYVSPAGSLEKDGKIYGRAVDGGYIENSGATTIFEIVRLLGELAARENIWSRVRPVVIHISNEQIDMRYVDSDLSSVPFDRKNEPTQLLAGVQAPLVALLKARDVHDAISRERLWGQVGSSSFLQFGLCHMPDQTDVPLGWSLSRSMANKLTQQLYSESCSAFNNQEQLRKVEQILAERYSRSIRR